MVQGDCKEKKRKRDGDLIVSSRTDSFREWKMDCFIDFRGGGRRRVKDLPKARNIKSENEIIINASSQDVTRELICNAIIYILDFMQRKF